MIGPAVPITIRPETPADRSAITALVKDAFVGAEHSDGSEPQIVERLRTHGDLTLSLVAEDEDGIVGHIAFSSVEIGDGVTDWYGLAPVSVRPALQGKGIGSALVKRGIADMRQRGARGIVLLGDPQYYGRFGFEHHPQLVFPGPPAEYFQALAIEGDVPSGVVQYAPAFAPPE